MNLYEVADLVRAPRPGADVSIRDLAYDTGKVTPGALFFCLAGRVFDGHDFADEAVRMGAAALVVTRGVDTPVPTILVRDARAALNQLSSSFFGDPSRRMRVCGVTGTNGKTTVTFMLESMAAAAGEPTGLIGTVRTTVAGQSVPSLRSTPESCDLQRTMAQMVEAGVPRCAMEVTSIGIAEGRIEGCWFDVVAFTNLSQDHLEYHSDMESYYEAKRALFDPSRARIGVINVDDPAGRRLLGETSLACHSVSVEGEADFVAREVEMGDSGSRFRLTGPDLDIQMRIKMPGPFNVANASCAAVAGHLMGLGARSIQGVASLDGVPGRFESVDEGQPFAVIVDYAHTPDALENILLAARTMAKGRTVVVFGCGGDRDRSKRPLMGIVAGRNADLVIATSDNPRSEDPADILTEVEAGLSTTRPTDGYLIIEDRRAAIEEALNRALPGDVVIIAGKGHETGQEVRGVKTHFDDREVASETLRRIL